MDFQFLDLPEVSSEGDLGFYDSVSYRYPLPITDKGKWEAAKEIISRYRDRPADYFTAWNILTQRDAQILADALWSENIPTLGFDFETKGWSPKVKLKDRDGELGRVSVSPSAEDFQPIPVTFQVSWGNVGYVVDAQYLYLFTEYLSERAKLDVANAGFEMTVFRRLHMPVRRFHRDCIHMDWLDTETIYNWEFRGRSLKKGLSPYHLGLTPQDFEDVFEDPSKYEGMWAEMPRETCEYAALDPILTSWISDILQDRLSKRPARGGYDSYELYHRVERNLQMSVIHMEQVGVPISRKALERHYDRIHKELDEIETKVVQAAGRMINLSSPKELGHLLFQEQGLPVQVTSPGFMCLICGKQVNKTSGNRCSAHGLGAIVNKPATDDSVLEGLAETGHPLAVLVQRHRSLSKELGTWVRGFWRIAANSWMYHPNFSTTNTISGRLAAGDALTTPKHLKDIFGFMDFVSEEYDSKAVDKSAYDLDPKTARRMTGGDYSQVEPRVLAHLCGDPVMIGNFKAGRDAHSTMASMILSYEEAGAKSFGDADLASKWYASIIESRKREKQKKPLREIDKRCLDTRDRAKTVGLGLAYGMGEDSLAKKMGCTLSEATKIMQIVFGAYSKLDPYFKLALSEGKAKKYLCTLGGRRKRLLEFDSKFEAERAGAERLTRNVPCQGGARDLVAFAHICLDIDQEAGGAYGKAGRGSYGKWVDGEWEPDWDSLPKGWEGQPPMPLFDKEKLGLLGRLGYNVWMECHDEFQAWGPAGYAQVAGDRIDSLMRSPLGGDLEFSVPLEVEWRSGLSWAETK